MPVTYGELRVHLQQAERDLKAQLDAIQRTVREDGIGYSNHMADVGTEVFEQALDVTLERQLRQKYEDVQHALVKFDDGTYAICECCGGIIDLARLEALPSARYCMDCQCRRELKR